QELLSDLPRLPASPQQLKAELAERRRHLQRRLIQETGGGVAVFVVCVVVWLASGATGQFWPIWVALVTLIPLLRNGWRLYGPAPELDRVERELETRGHRGGRHAPRAELERAALERYEQRRSERAGRRAERYDRRRGG